MLNVPNEVKDFLKSDSAHKNIRISFPNGEREDITNENLVAESLKFTESICSQDNLKFGLSEASLIEFQCFGVGNIKGMEIDASTELMVESKEVSYTEKNLDNYVYETGIAEFTKTITTNNESASITFNVLSGKPYTITIIEKSLISNEETTTNKELYVSSFYDTLSFDYDFVYSGNKVITVSVTSTDVNISFSSMKLHYTKKTYSIPYGRFVVDSCKRHADMNRRKVIAYSQGVSSQSNYSDIERAKRNMPVFTNVPYTFDLYKFLASNVSNMQVNGDKTLCETIIEEGVQGIYYDPSQITTWPWFTVSCYWTQETCYFGSDSENSYYSPEELYVIEYKKDPNYKLKIEEAIERTSKYIPTGLKNALERFFNAEFVMELQSSGDTNLPLISSSTKGVQIDKDCIIYPKCDGFYVPGNNVKIAVKRSVATIIVYDRLSREEIDRFTVTNDSVGNLYKLTLSDISNLPTIEMSINRTPVRNDRYKVVSEKLELYHILNSYLELNAMFGRYSRNGKYIFDTINKNFGLYPSETLYPSEDLYPQDPSGGIISPSNVYSLWHEEYLVREFGKIYVYYKDKDGNEQLYTHIIDENNLNFYKIKDNYILDNYGFTEEEVENIITNYFVPNATGITYLPIELKMKGLPYIEAGDAMVLLTSTGGVESFVFKRTLSGIQNLIDSIEARGDEINQDATIMEE